VELGIESEQHTHVSCCALQCRCVLYPDISAQVGGIHGIQVDCLAGDKFVFRIVDCQGRSGRDVPFLEKEVKPHMSYLDFVAMS
jgi:hypothetical protein